MLLDQSCYGNGGSDGKTNWKNGSCRVENGEMGTEKDKIRNKYVRGTAKIAKLGDKLRNARPCWYGHMKGREEGYVGRRMKEINIAGIPRMSSVTIFQSDHFVLSTNLLFKFTVSLPLVTGELLQNTVDVNNVTYKLYNIKI